MNEMMDENLDLMLPIEEHKPKLTSILLNKKKLCFLLVLTDDITSPQSWLPVHFRIDYKILLITFKVLLGLAPSYIADMSTT